MQPRRKPIRIRRNAIWKKRRKLTKRQWSWRSHEQRPSFQLKQQQKSTAQFWVPTHLPFQGPQTNPSSFCSHCFSLSLYRPDVPQSSKGPPQKRKKPYGWLSFTFQKTPPSMRPLVKNSIFLSSSQLPNVRFLQILIWRECCKKIFDLEICKMRMFSSLL